MRKRSELSEPTSCLNRAAELELVFVLRGHDRAAPATIRFWTRERLRLGKNLPGDAQLTEAIACAGAMERERAGYA